MNERGAIVYRGPSLLSGEPIVAIVTGLKGDSRNPKTGPICQVWILRSDRSPMAAIRDGSDAAICGTCSLRGDGAYGRVCYVSGWLGPANVYKAYRRGRYPEPSWPELQAAVAGQHVRLGAYGDPAAVPFEVWRALLETAAGWIGYTHQWRRCDPRLRELCMASVDSEAEFASAHLRQWRTFRVRGRTDPVLEGYEFVCPASDEGQHRTTCQRCQLCRGRASPARSVVIMAHGMKSATVNFYRRHPVAGRDFDNTGIRVLPSARVR